jgi:WD40 repeat protein
LPRLHALAAGLLGLVLCCAAVAVGVASFGSAAGPPRPPAARTGSRGPAADALGDPLPPGAVARFGTRRLIGSGHPTWATFSPDGKTVASRGLFGITAWDAATGRQVAERTKYDVMANAAGWRADGTGVAVVRLADGSLFVSAFTDPREKLPTPPPFYPSSIPNPYIYHLALSPDATRLAVARNPNANQFTIDFLPATPGRPLAALKPYRTLGPFPGPCRDVRYTADGHLVTLHGDPKVKGDWSLALIDPVRNRVARTSSIPAPGYCPWQYMLSLSGDARLAAVAPRTRDYPNDHDGTIRVWDLAAGKEIRSLPFPSNGYKTGHAFTPDGKLLVTSPGEPYFQVWNLAAGKEIARAPREAGAFYSQEAAGVAVSPDGKRFATARRDGRVDVWDTATAKAVVPLGTHRDQIDAVAVSADGRLAATVGYDSVCRVWEVETGKPACVIPAPRGKDPAGRNWTKRRPAFTPDGRGLLFASGGVLALVDPLSGKPTALPAGLRGLRGYVGGFAADGRTLATFAAGAVTLWDWPAGKARATITVPLQGAPAKTLKGGPMVTAINSVVLSSDGRLLFTNSVRQMKGDLTGGGIHNTNDVWDARTGKHLHRLAKPETWYPPAVFAPDGRAVYLGGHSLDAPKQGRQRTDALTAWDARTGKLIRRFADPGEGARRDRHDFGRDVAALAVSPDGRLLAAYEGHGGSLDVWVHETVSGRVIRGLAGHSGRVSDLAFTPDGRRLVSVSEDQTGLVWDVTVPALGGPRAGKVSDAWERLAAPDAGLGYLGMASLVSAPAEGVRILRANLRPAPVPTEAELDRVVRQLDAEALADRDKASAELERYGPNAVAGAKARLRGTTSAEVRRRLTQFLRRHDTDPSPYRLRCVRGVAALEAMGTAEAKALLDALAKGPADDVLTREARATSGRGRR